MEFKKNGNDSFAEGKKEDAIETYTQGIRFIEDRNYSATVVAPSMSGRGDATFSTTPSDNTTGSEPRETTVVQDEQKYQQPTGEDIGCLHLLYCNRSMVRLSLCLVSEALQDAEKSIQLNPTFGKAYARRAAVLADLFQFEDALVDARRAAELDEGLIRSSLAEIQQRASGKLWVPNCYLKQQVELQRKHRCDYVLLPQHTPLKLADPSRLGGAIRTGKGTEGILNDIEAGFSKVTRGTNIGGVQPQIDAEMLGDQLRREFGAKGNFTRAANIQDLFAAAEKGNHAKVAKLLMGNCTTTSSSSSSKSATFLDVNAKDGQGKTPLHWAAQSDHALVAEVLLSHGALLAAQDNYSQTPLHTAAFQDAVNVMAIFLVASKKEHSGATTPLLLVKDQSGSRALDMICPDDEVYVSLKAATEEAACPP